MRLMGCVTTSRRSIVAANDSHEVYVSLLNMIHRFPRKMKFSTSSAAHMCGFVKCGITQYLIFQPHRKNEEEEASQ